MLGTLFLTLSLTLIQRDFSFSFHQLKLSCSPSLGGNNVLVYIWICSEYDIITKCHFDFLTKAVIELNKIMVPP